LIALVIRRLFLFVFIVGAALLDTAEAQRSVIVMRHAERLDSSSDSPLSKVGEASAARLVSQFKYLGIKAIFVTEFARTAQTAEPLARSLGLKPIVVPAADPASLVQRLRSQHANDVVLVIGHSNTIPRILKDLGAKEEVVITDDQYNDVYIFTPGSSVLLRLHL
jgi:broad specificity phosphatase PhoE